MFEASPARSGNFLRRLVLGLLTEDERNACPASGGLSTLHRHRPANSADDTLVRVARAHAARAHAARNDAAAGDAHEPAIAALIARLAPLAPLPSHETTTDQTTDDRAPPRRTLWPRTLWLS